MVCITSIAIAFRNKKRLVMKLKEENLFLMILLLTIALKAITIPDAASKVLIFSDQLNDNPGSANFIFAASHYIGMQKVDKARINAYKLLNPGFIVVQYHKSYGVDLQQNITSANPPYWNNDCDSLYAWQKRNTQYGALEQYYLHFGNKIDSAHRIEHYWDNVNEYWLADIRQEGYRKYVAEETSRRCKEIGFDGSFFDCSYFPSYGYVPEDWCTKSPWNVQSIVAFNTQWNDSFAVPFWKFISNYYHSEGRNYLCLPNCDQMVTGWYDDRYLDYVDGAMVEGFFTYGGILTGSDWTLSAGRILKYLTGKDINKIMIAQPGITQENIKLRRWCIANYFLLKNKFSYYNIAYSSTANWWPEYDIDLGTFVTTPAVLSDLLVQGKSSLYKRDYQNGLVLVNPGSATETYILTDYYEPVSFTGGGNLSNGTLPSMNLLYGTAITGSISIASGEVLILRKKNGTSITNGIRNKRNGNSKIHPLCQGILNGRLIKKENHAPKPAQIYINIDRKKQMF
jgi:hypothetical protein